MIDQVVGTLFVMSSLMLLIALAYLIVNSGYKNARKNVFPPIVKDQETIMLTNFNNNQFKINCKNEFMDIIKPKKYKNKTEVLKAIKSNSKKTEIKHSIAVAFSAGSCISHQNVESDQKNDFNKIKVVEKSINEFNPKKIDKICNFIEESVVKTSYAAKVDDSQNQKENQNVINDNFKTDYKSNVKISKIEDVKVNLGIAPPARKRRVMKSYVGLKRKLKELKNLKFLQSGSAEKCDPLSKIKDLDRRIYMLKKSKGYTC